jgi:hypothetical protein
VTTATLVLKESLRLVLKIGYRGVRVERREITLVIGVTHLNNYGDLNHKGSNE